MPPNKRRDGVDASCGSAEVDAAPLSYDGHQRERQPHTIAIETPVNIIYGSLPFAVMMATPTDLEDFAYGFSFTEGIIDAADDVRELSLTDTDDGLKLSVSLKADNMQRHLGRARNLTGRTGCGVCGIADLSEMPNGTTKLSPPAHFQIKSIARALEQSQTKQVLNASTRAVHGAAFCNWGGDIVALREDVGRHNALDKLIGALLRGGHNPADGFMLITSRASYEMIEKTARAGSPVLVAMSAPTSLAIERADAYGLTLIAVAREDGAIQFTPATQDQTL